MKKTVSLLLLSIALLSAEPQRVHLIVSAGVSTERSAPIYGSANSTAELSAGARMADEIELTACANLGGSVQTAGAELFYAPRIKRYYPALGIGYRYGNVTAAYSTVRTSSLEYIAVRPLSFYLGSAGSLDMRLSFGEFRFGPFISKPKIRTGFSRSGDQLIGVTLLKLTGEF